ncbi:MAG: alpha/beta fold hydrolase [Nevskiales bacterium]|nr:alpha/beta fold hydrolase [Nevskiales bacterium]
MHRARYDHDGLSLSYLDSAPDDPARPAVLLLHGFPDSAQMWHEQIEALHAAGLRAIAPDMRGYGDSSMAASTGDYAAARILGDFAALLDHLDIQRAHVVGHDWGAVLAWMFAGRFPQRVDRLAVISVGHPTAYARAGVDQKIAGWYTLFFLLRGISERLLLSSGPTGLRTLMRSHPDVEEVLQRMRQPGRMTAALGIYRANLSQVLFGKHPSVEAPTLGIWSEGDAYLVESQMKNSDRYVGAPWRYERVPGGHWVPLEQPERLNALLLDHLGAAASA